MPALKTRSLLCAAALCIAASNATAATGAVANLAEALRIPTVSRDQRDHIDYSAFRRFLAFLEQTYPGLHARLEEERVNDYSLLIRWPGTSAVLAPVLFEAHYDVTPVEPGTESDWTHPPFAGAVADGYLWGRGAVDDKLSVIAMFEALESLSAEGYRPERDLYIAVTTKKSVAARALPPSPRCSQNAICVSPT